MIFIEETRTFTFFKDNRGLYGVEWCESMYSFIMFSIGFGKFNNNYVIGKVANFFSVILGWNCEVFPPFDPHDPTIPYGSKAKKFKLVAQISKSCTWNKNNMFTFKILKI